MGDVLSTVSRRAFKANFPLEYRELDERCATLTTFEASLGAFSE
jgi:hypothetical protein